MNPHIQFLLIVGPAVVLVIFGAYLKFRRGLGTRIFATVCPMLGLTGYAGFFAGHGGRAIDLGIATLIAIVFNVPLLIVFHRMVVMRLQREVSTLTSNTAQLAATARQSASTANEQASTVAEVGTTVEEITQTSAATASTAKKVLNVSESAVEKGEKGVAAVDEAVHVMKSVSAVSEIVELIRELAEQSNLLAVNAGIEAAKAGEQGRGFAVVAGEVRSLAEQSKRATQQIRSAIKNAEDGQQAIGKVGLVISELSAVLEESADSARQISAAAAQQAAGIQQISDAMVNVAQGGRDTADGARQLDQAVAALTDVGQGIDTFING